MLVQLERITRLGRLGEDLVGERLRDYGFTDIENLNLRRTNYPFGDLLASKDGVRYFIGVKARNQMRQGQRWPERILQFDLNIRSMECPTEKARKNNRPNHVDVVGRSRRTCIWSRRNARLGNGVNQSESGDLLSLFWACRTAWK
jgi:hypothetical protein